MLVELRIPVRQAKPFYKDWVFLHLPITAQYHTGLRLSPRGKWRVSVVVGFLFGVGSSLGGGSGLID